MAVRDLYVEVRSNLRCSKYEVSLFLTFFMSDVNLIRFCCKISKNVFHKKTILSSFFFCSLDLFLSQFAL